MSGFSGNLNNDVKLLDYKPLRVHLIIFMLK